MVHETPPAHDRALVRLSDTNLVLADDDLDIRDRKVVDKDGSDIGHVEDLFIDEHERKVRMLQIRAGGFLGLGERHFLLPVDAITSVARREVIVNETLERVVASPAYDPALVPLPNRSDWGPYYGYYGLPPYWGSAYLYPRFPIFSERAAPRDRFTR